MLRSFATVSSTECRLRRLMIPLSSGDGIALSSRTDRDYCGAEPPEQVRRWSLNNQGAAKGRVSPAHRIPTECGSLHRAGHDSYTGGKAGRLIEGIVST